MTAVDPLELLKALSHFLGAKGQIKNMEDVIKVIGLMKESKKLASRCTYLNILRATTDDDVLQQFVLEGGWDIMNTWMSEAREQQQGTLLVEILRVYKSLPVSVELLKRNSCAKTIKQLAKCDDKDLKSLAGLIVEEWTKKIREQSSSGDADGGSDKKKKKKHHSKEKEERDGDSHKHKHHHNHHHHHHNSSNQKKDNDSSGSGNSSPSTSTNSSSKSSNSSQKPAESKPRASTVKTAPSKFRSTGKKG